MTAYNFPALKLTIDRYVQLAEDFTGAEHRLMHQLIENMYADTVQFPEDWPPAYRSARSIQMLRHSAKKQRHTAEGGSVNDW